MSWLSDAPSRARRALGIAGAQAVAAARLPGTEVVALGGGELVPTPGVAALPVTRRDRQLGLAGDALALPPATVRILKGVRICPDEGVVLDAHRAVVAESVSTERMSSVHLPRPHTPCRHLHGSVAPYGVPGGTVCESLLECLPRTLLLQHPALHRWAPVTVVRRGPLSPVERWLLDRMEDRQVHVEPVADDLVDGDRVLVASPVTRARAGAIPRWYNRWVASVLEELPAEATAGVRAPSPLALVHGADDPLRTHPRFAETVEDAGLEVLDTAAPPRRVDDMLVKLRDAPLVVGASDAALAHSLLCRRARVVQVGLSPTVSPRIAQLCLSRGVPFEFLEAAELPLASPLLASGR